MNPKVKGFLKGATDWAMLVLLVPQAFLYCYYFPYLFHRMGNSMAFLKALMLCGLMISWVSSPFLTVLYFCARSCLARKIPGALFWVGAFLSGYLWLAIWNLVVFQTFGWLRSLLPIFFCSTAATLYAVASRLYREAIRPPERGGKKTE